MRRNRAHSTSPSPPFRALALPMKAANATAHVNDPANLIRFNCETNPSRPIRPSPLTASAVRDLPLELLDRLRSFPLFVAAPDDFLTAILTRLRPQVHASQDHILTEGDEARAMYWLVRGVVAVTSRDGEAIYAELKPGAFFGEIGVLMNVPRTATIIARTKCLLVVLMKEDLVVELPRFPDMERAMMQEATERLSLLQKKRQPDDIVVSVMRPGICIARSPTLGTGGQDDGSSILTSDCTTFPSTKLKSPIPSPSPSVEELAVDSGLDSVMARGPISTTQTEGFASTILRRYQLPTVNLTMSSQPDPDPFLSVSMEAMRKRRRSSLAALHDGGVDGRTVSGIKSPTMLVAPSVTQVPSACPTAALATYQSPFPAKRQKMSATSLVPSRRSGLAVNDTILIRIFRHLGLRELMELRRVSLHWRTLLTTSAGVCLDVDFRPYNRHVTDESIATVLAPFIGSRPVSIDLSNCFHVTDVGFACLWQQCGRNVRRWRMRSVWEVSADQIVKMSNNTKNLEEIDLSNCRKVGDSLLARVIGWVKPEVLAEQQQQCRRGHEVGPQFASSQQGIHPTKQRRKEQRCQPADRAEMAEMAGTSLSRLDLSYCKHITDRSMIYLAMQASGRLRSLTLTRCTSITDTGFQTWAPFRFPQLTRLCLADCTYLTDRAVAAVVKAAANLTELNLSFCCALSDAATQTVALGLPRLRTLQMAFCGLAVSDRSLGCLGQHLGTLEVLSVRGCVQVTGAGVESVLVGCGRLRYLDVSQCRNLDPWLRTGAARARSQVQLVVIKGSDGGLR